LVELFETLHQRRQINSIVYIIIFFASVNNVAI